MLKSFLLKTKKTGGGAGNKPAEILSRRILAIDIGGGTQDILIYDENQPMENCYKMILPSPTVILARKIRKLTMEKKPIYLTGELMGGGPCTRAIKLHLKKGLPVYSSPRAAKTIKDDPEKVKGLGVQITDAPPEKAETLTLSDVDLQVLQKTLESFEIEMPEEFAVAVQDHGESIDMSNRLFRFKHWERFMTEGGDISSLIYYDIPPYLTRMKSVQKVIPKALVMDTCSAALWGALEDENIARHRDKGLTLINMGNQHTFAVLLKGSIVYGLLEHHTGILTFEQLQDYVNRFKSRTVTHQEIFDSGGHGCYIKDNIQDSDSFEFTAVTGPQRHLARKLGYYEAAPYGDMMLTGSFGLVSAALTTT